MSNRYFSHNDLDREGALRHVSQFDVLHPQFRSPARAVTSRDRYRASQYDNPMYDVVEDDEAYVDGAPFDSFDERLLQQPHDDRQRQAAQGRARLSFAPASSRLFDNAVPLQLQSQPSYEAPRHEQHDSIGYQDHSQHAFHGQLGRFAYSVAQPQEPSSDAPLGISSGLALKAGQRRAEQSTDQSTRHGARSQLLEHKQLYAVEQQRPGYSKSHQQHRVADHESYQDVNRSLELVTPPKPQAKPTYPSHDLPLVQGIRLVPIVALPDRLRGVFPYPTFNAVQSKCFDKIFRSNDNFVLASPTGSGKTVILELAICRAVATSATGQYKVVYQAPTKALCSERHRDWEKKFNHVGLKCAELTGDSDVADLRNVQSANIIITTPEKWDSITRKWKDHEKLMRLVKLFLIDEVHILKEDRGAVLEAVVSRMKSIGTDVRFVALSATVPNFQDVASWLGKSSAEPYEPASNEKFGEEFRPVKLRKHVCGFASNSSNDFAFEKTLDAKLPDVITKYSERKPMMVFCATRNSTVNTAKLIAKWWTSISDRDRLWNPPSKAPHMLNKDLRDTVASGVAFHHAGLDQDDRMQVERGFLNGEISVICCTSTLAVGVNLPCHLVIIKNTMSFTAEGLQEYSDLEMMQMLGRAGRPQWDDTAVAVIMTRQPKVRRYEMMVTGEELLESKLHLNLIDHMNAEIGLGTIRDLLSARTWLTSTFLYVRLQQNPEYYKLDGARSGQNLGEQIDDICFRDIALLREHNLVSGQESFRCTEFGHAMARYYVHFETMKVLMGLQSRSSPSEVLSAIVQASEFSTIRFRQGEKSLYKTINKSPSIRWAIPVNLDLPAQKVSLIIQSILGSADISWDGEMGKYRSQYNMDTQVVFKNIGSLIRCIIDCQICLGDSTSIHSALMLERSIGARAWDDSPLQLKQVEGIGVVAVRKLVNAGIRSIDDIEACDPHRIETLVGRNPPFGLKVLEAVRSFPRLRVSLHAQPSSIIKTHDGVKIQVKADIGFINEKPPQCFGNKAIYVCLLAETSDGRKIHFARISGPKLGTGQSLIFPALLTSADQSINCYVMCDGISGSMRGATVKPQVTPTMFPAAKLPETDTPHQSNMSKRRIENLKPRRRPSATSDDFGDDEIDDDELVKASFGDLDFDHIDMYANPTDAITRKNTIKNKSAKDKSHAKSAGSTAEDDTHEPVQLANGNWVCNHKCKDKAACKHLCCKDGVDKPPKKKVTTKNIQPEENRENPPEESLPRSMKKTQSKLHLTVSKRKSSAPIEELDLTQQEKKRKTVYAIRGPRDYRDLHQLHKTTQGKELPSSLHLIMHKKPAYCYSQGGDHSLSFLDQPTTERVQSSSDYGDIQVDEVTSRSNRYEENVGRQDLNQLSDIEEIDEAVHYAGAALEFSSKSDTFGDDDSLLGDAMVGLADSQNLQTASNSNNNMMQVQEPTLDDEDDTGYRYDDLFMDVEFSPMEVSNGNDAHGDASRPVAPSSVNIFAQELAQSLCMKEDEVLAQEDTSRHAGSIRKQSDVIGLRQSKTTASVTRPRSTTKILTVEGDIPDSLDMNGAPQLSHAPAKEKEVPDAFKGLELWLFEEFGDIVELIDE